MEPPIIDLTKIVIVNSNMDSVIYSKSDKFPTELKIKNGTKVRFDYIGKVNVKPDKVVYRVKLKGYDTDWTPVTSNNFVVYDNLKEGDYALSVLACNSSGLWTVDPFTYKFKIKSR